MNNSSPFLAVIALITLAACSDAPNTMSPAAESPQPSFAKLSSSSFLTPQFCDHDRGPENRLVHMPLPNPVMVSAAQHGGVEAMYKEASVEQVSRWLVRYDAIAYLALNAYLNADGVGDASKLARAADHALALAKETRAAHIAVRPGTGRPGSAPIELDAADLALQIAYMEYDLQGDSRQFASRVASIIETSDRTDRTYRFLEPNTATSTGQYDRLRNYNLASIRAVGLYRLLMGKREQAINAFRYLLERHAWNADGASFWPYDAADLAARLRAGALSDAQLLDKLKAAPKPDRCSTLLNVYVDWLDLASRALQQRPDPEIAKRVKREVALIERTVPPVVLGKRAARAVKRILQKKITRQRFRHG